MHEGDVVLLLSSGQAGTITSLTNESASVLLRNGYLWHGPVSQLRFPQSQEDLDAAPIDVEIHEPKRQRKKP